MEKKASVGVIFWSIVIIITALLGLIFGLSKPLISVGNVLNVFYIICAIGALLLKEWARKAIVIISLISSIILVLALFFFALKISMFLLGGLCLLAINIGELIFFTRPKVKEQFKQGPVTESKRSLGMWLAIVYPAGISLFSLSVLFELGLFSGIRLMLKAPERARFIFERGGFFVLFYSDIISSLLILFTIGMIISLFFILQFKNWARKLYIFLMCLWLLPGIDTLRTKYKFDKQSLDVVDIIFYFVCFLLPMLVAVLYFTRPKVKELFKKEERWR
jgi:hypothetical protein